MSRLSQAFAFFNLPPEKLTSDWINCHMTDITINDKMKELRRLHRKEQKQVAKQLVFDEFKEQKDEITQKKNDLILVSQGKMTKEEYRDKWVK